MSLPANFVSFMDEGHCHKDHVAAAEEEPAISILLETAKVLKDSLFKTP